MTQGTSLDQESPELQAAIAAQRKAQNEEYLRANGPRVSDGRYKGMPRPVGLDGLNAMQRGYYINEDERFAVLQWMHDNGINITWGGRNPYDYAPAEVSSGSGVVVGPTP